MPLPHSSTSQRPKIGDLVQPLHTYNVLRFDISMNDSMPMDDMQTFGSVKTNVKKLLNLDVGVHLDESVQGAGAQFEQNVHSFVVDP